MNESSEVKKFVDMIYPYMMQKKSYISGLAACQQVKEADSHRILAEVDLSAFTPKQTVWKLLLKPVFQSDIFIMDSSLGAAPLDLSKSYRRIMVFQPYEKAAEIIECRVAEAGINNIDVVSRIDVKELENRKYRFGMSIFVINNSMIDLFGKAFLAEKIGELIEMFSCFQDDHYATYIIYPKKYHLHLKNSRPCFMSKNGLSHSYIFSLKRRHRLKNFNRYSLRNSSQYISEVRITETKKSGLNILRIFQKGNIHARIKNRLKRMSVTWPWELISFTNEESPLLWLDELLKDISANLGGNFTLHVKRYFAGNPFMILLKLGSSSKNDMICRVPLGRKGSLIRAKNNYDTLVRLQNDKKLKDIIPQPYCHGSHQGQPYYLEKMLKGHQQSLSKENFKLLYASVRPVLFYFHQALGNVVKIDSTVFDHLVGSDLSVMKANARSIGDRECVSALHKNLEERLLNKTLTLPLLHGDFKIENMLFSRKKLTGVFDWDLSSYMGFPFIDLLYFYGYSFHYLSEKKDRFIHNFIVGELLNKNHSPILKECMDEYSKHLSIADEFKDISGIIFWVHYLIRTTSAGFSISTEKEYEANFRQPLMIILNKFC